jgi:hypothetical protein
MLNPKPSPLLPALVAAGVVLCAPSVPACAAQDTPSRTVASFYDWYLAHHGYIQRSWGQVKTLFDSQLYELVDETYFKEGNGNEPFMVSTCPSENRPCKELPWDPFSNSPSHATSYAIGSTRSGADQTEADVKLRLTGGTESHVTVDLRRGESGYVITNLRYSQPRYYYTGAIVDLAKFLGAYNC